MNYSYPVNAIRSRKTFSRFAGQVVLLAVALPCLAILSQRNYLLFHTLVELGAVAVAWGVFMLIWSARRIEAPRAFWVLGVGYALVGSLDLLHALAYEGMGVLQDVGADKATQFWMAARFVEAAVLLVFPLSFAPRFPAKLVAGLLIVGGFALAADIMFWDMFPVCFDEETGLTLFKRVGEYGVMGAMAVAGYLLWSRRDHIGSPAVYFVLASIGTTMVSEFCFTRYDHPYAMANMAGHLLKVLSFYLLYRALLVEGLERPLATLGKGLREQTDKALRQASLLNQVSDAIISTDRSLRITSWNAAAEQIYGWTAREAVGQHVDKLLETDWIDRSLAEARQTLMDSGTWKGVVQQCCKNGQRITVEVSVSWLRDVEGSILGGITVNRDISEKQRAVEEAERLHRNLEQRERILTSMGQAAELMLGNENWSGIEDSLRCIGEGAGVQRVYIFENHRSKDGRLLASQRFEWCHPDVQPQIGNPELQDLCYDAGAVGRWGGEFSAGRTVVGLVSELPDVERTALAAQGIVSVAAVPIFVQSNWWGFIGFDDCLAERVWSESELSALQATAQLFSAYIVRAKQGEALRASESRYRTLFELSNDAIFVHDGHGVFYDLNDRACEMLGYTREELMALTTSDCHPPAEQAAGIEGFRQLRARGHHRFDTEFIRKDGTVLSVEISARRLYKRKDKDFPGGEPELFQGIARDVTGRKRLERHLMESSEREQQRLAEELHDGLCQDMKSLEIDFALLENQIAGFSSEAASLARELGAKVNQAVRNAYGIVHGMLPVGLDAHNFGAAIEDLARKARGQTEGVVLCRIDPSLEPRGKMQAHHLYRIAQEALNNALHHAHAAEIALEWRREDGYAVLRVADNGNGFEGIRKESGSGGMGLAVMRSRAEAIKASLDLCKGPEGGTVVRCAAALDDKTMENTQEP